MANIDWLFPFIDLFKKNMRRGYEYCAQVQLQVKKFISHNRQAESTFSECND